MLLIVLSTFSSAQEELLNYSNHAKNRETRSAERTAGSTNFLLLADTLDLPFIDDFSSDQLLLENTDLLDSSYTSIVQYQFQELDGSPALTKDSLSVDSAYIITMTASDTDTVSIAAVDTVLQFDYDNYPETFLDSIRLFPAYNLVDSFNTGSYDTLMNDIFVNDSSIFNLINDYENLWVDNLALINDNYPIDPPSIGVATMDAVDHYGAIYNHGGSAPFSADSLTSKWIDLAGKGLNDSLVLSFYLQAGGNGDDPDGLDVLSLLFRDTNDLWIEVWSSNDQANALDGNFNQYFVAVDDSSFYHGGFQFMFVNTVTLTTIGNSWQNNADFWNIDYVILDEKRFEGDNYIKELNFVSPVKSIFEKYSRVPLDHVSSVSLIKNFESIINNSSSSAENLALKTLIYDDSDTIFNASNSLSISSNAQDTFTQSTSGLNFTTQSGYQQYQLKQFYSTVSGDPIPENDTAVYQIEFDQVYAYDDGSSEAGYGLNAFEGKFAQLYEIEVSDTLTAIDIFFNQTLTNTNFDVGFNLKVWEESAGYPSTEIASSISQLPRQSDSINVFLSYKLDDPIVVGGSIFIGWEQLSDDFMNVGFDNNSDGSGLKFYNVDGQWKASSLPGIVLIRPRFGSERFLSTAESNKNTLSILPNPVSSHMYLPKDKIGTVYSIVDQFGKTIISEEVLNHHTTDCSFLSAGLYFITTFDGIKVERAKFIKN